MSEENGEIEYSREEYIKEMEHTEALMHLLLTSNIVADDSIRDLVKSVLELQYAYLSNQLKPQC